VNKPATLHIDVDFYDETHRHLLSAYPNADLIRACVKHGVDIPIEEFYTHYLFHRKPAGNDGHVTYESLARETYKAKAWLDDQLSLDGTIALAPERAELPKDITERTGEAVGLSVVNRILRLTEADWERIPQGKQKTFDYGHNIASDGVHIVQVETKGTCVVDPGAKSPTVSTAKGSIEEKKSDIDSIQATGQYPYPASVRIGTITAIPKSPGAKVRCWLLDPEPDPVNSPPGKLRLVSRMGFLRRWLSFISPQSPVAIALSNRVAALIAINDPASLSRVRLLDGTGRTIEPRTVNSRGQERLSFFASKSVVVDGPTGGVVAQATEDKFVFVGVMEELVEQALEQDFDTIVRYRKESGVVRKEVECVFSNSRFARLDLPAELERRVERSRQYAAFRLRGDLYYSQTGLVFGVLGLPSESS